MFFDEELHIFSTLPDCIRCVVVLHLNIILKIYILSSIYKNDVRFQLLKKCDSKQFCWKCITTKEFDVMMTDQGEKSQVCSEKQKVVKVVVYLLLASS